MPPLRGGCDLSDHAQDEFDNHLKVVMSEPEPRIICFAGRKGMLDFFKRQNKPFIQLYWSPIRSVAVLSATGSVSGVSGLVKAKLGLLAILRSETQLREVIPEAEIYDDFPSFLEQASKTTILTRNADMGDAIRGVHGFEFVFLCYNDDFWAIDLAVGHRTSDFMDLLNRLGQASDLALSELSALVKHSGDSISIVSGRASYSLFAQYYDHYMEHVGYDDWVDLMVSWYKRHTDQPLRKVLELACGTANASEIFVFRGIDVDACDSSQHMLHVAEAKAFKPNLYCRKLTDTPPGKEYDLAFCLFDSVNYLTKRTDIITMLKNVRDSLRPGGIFIFDISTLLNSLQNFNDTINYTKVKDGYLVQISRFEILSSRQWTTLTLFRKALIGYERLEERHEQRVYRCQELVELIAASGLKLKAIHSPDYKANLLPKLSSDLDNRYTRIFFVLVNEA